VGLKYKRLISYSKSSLLRQETGKKSNEKSLLLLALDSLPTSLPLEISAFIWQLIPLMMRKPSIFYWNRS
jgi:hypothetical protein